MIYKKELTKPDGRKLILYSSSPISAQIEATQPAGERIEENPHMRWHPLRGEWVTYASFRQERTFLPPAEFNPLAPSPNPAQPSEIPVGRYDAVVFENRFPSLAITSGDELPQLYLPTRPATGICEVIVFTQKSDASLGTLPLSHLLLLIDVWIDRYNELGSREEIRYVMPFENRGVEVGVTLHHPHGQIYAYPVVPPVIARELEMQKEYFGRHRKGLLQAQIESEIEDGRRMVFSSPEVVAFVPACARYPYEVWIAPRRAIPSLSLFDDASKISLAMALKTVLLKYDALWSRAFPYIMVFHQEPTDGLPHPEAHFHIEFYPPYRNSGRLKYLAGTEVGAGFFTNDTLPEEKAAELREIEIDIEE